MKILYDHQIFVAQKFGGISRYFIELMQIDDAGLEIECIDPTLCAFPEAELKYDLYSRGIRYIKRKVGLEKTVERILPSAVTGKISGNSYDLFHPTYYDPYFLQLTEKPFVLTVYDMIHEIYKESFPLSDETSYNKRLLCEKAKAIIAISNKTKEDIIEIFKIPEEKIHPIQLASRFDKVFPVKPAETERLTNYILFTGLRAAYKNFYFCVIALADILKADASLQLLCTGHKFSNEELQFFKDLGLLDQVHHIFLKNDHELAWAYQNAAFFIFPSLYEGFGFPLLEAFASNCPVISSKGGSLLEVGGEGALYFDPKSIMEIQDAAAEVLYSPARRSSLIEKGQIQYKKFSWDTCRIKTSDVYHQAINT